MTTVKPNIESQFSLRWLTVAIIATAIAFSWFVLSGYLSYQRGEVARQRIFRLTDLQGTLVYFDEALTMSARMSAATGKPKWERRYRSIKPKLNAAIEEAKELMPEESADVTIDMAEKKANAMEVRAFVLVEQRRLNEAQAILFSEQYEQQQLLYSHGVQQLSMHLQNAINAERQSQQQRRTAQQQLAFCLVPLMAAMWLITLRVMRQGRIALIESGLQLENKANSLTELNATLEQKVSQRVGDAEASRIAALNIMEDATESRAKAEALNHDLLNEIAERNQAEALLQESQQRLALATESAGIGIWDWDVVANKMVWDAQMIALYGIQEQDFTGAIDAWQNGLHPEDRANAEAEITAALNSSRDFHPQFRVVWPNGEIHFIEAHAFVKRADDGSPLRMIGVNWDITERKLDEAALRRSEERYRSLTLATSQIVWTASADGMMEDMPAWREFTGQSLEEVKGRGWIQALHADDRERIEKTMDDCLEIGIYEDEYRVCAANGNYRLFAVRGVPIFEEDGSVREWVGTFTDIHDQRKAELERDRFFTLTLDMLGIADSSGYFKRLNPAFEATLGFSNEELSAVPLLEFVHPDDRTATLQVMGKLTSGETILQFENRYRCRDGSYKWLQWKTVPFEDLWYFAARDVTEIIRTEQTIRESEEYFRFLNDLSEATRLLTDPEQIMAVMARMLGEHLRVSRCAYADVEPDGEDFTIVHDYTDGCASTVGKYQLSLFGPRAVATLHSGTTLIIRNVEVELLPNEGAEMFQSIGIQAIIVCPLVKNGVLRGMMAVHQTTPRDWQPREITLVQDVVERCWATIERRAAEEKIYQLNADLEHRVIERTTQLEAANTDLQAARETADTANLAKSEFLSRMSHELRTPLNAILGFGQILNKGDLDPLSKESVGYILKGGRHLLDLINEVLDIARVEAGHVELSLEPIALDDVVPDACALVQPLAAERNIRLQENTSELGGSHILADRQRFKQVLINLLSNAIKYNREGGQVEVACELKPEGWTSIAVRDTGPGISPEDLLKLFTPFERLGVDASEVEGTGLGLVLSQRLVTAMGGTLKVESTLGRGTTFTVEFPQATPPQEQLANLPDDSAHMETSKGTECNYSILCVEDNPSNLRLIEAILEDRPNITLLSAMQGGVGLDLARQHEPDLILLDLNLPDIHGSEVLARLQQSALTRDIPVIVISADATPKQIERLLAGGAREYLTKPLDIDRFLLILDKFMQATTAIVT